MWSAGISRPIPWNTRSVQAKIARRIHASKRPKRDLNRLYEALAPGSTVGKLSPTTSVMKEPNKPEVIVRNLHFTKFGTKYGCDTDPAPFAELRPPK